MAHTDRDIERVYWRDHWLECEALDRRRGTCRVCLHLPPQYRLYDWPEPSWWNRMERKTERAKERNQIQRARAGRLDWDDLPSGAGRIYRRPYYW